MERDRNTRIIAVLALVVAVVGLSVGFAAFSDQLTITPSSEVNPKDTFDVKLSAINDGLRKDNVTVTRTLEDVSAPGYSGAMAYGAAAVISNDYKSIDNLKAYFTEPNQSITYTFYAINGVDYDAYLDSVEFIPASGQKWSIPAESEATEALVAAASEDIKVSIKIGSELDYRTPTTADNSNIMDHLLAASPSERNLSYETIEVKIEYIEGGHLADGKFEVDLGSIKLNYTSNVKKTS